MDEDPKDHDFDQRRDGPMQTPTENDPSQAESSETPALPTQRTQRPSVQIADLPANRRTVSNGANPLEKSTSAQSAPNMRSTKTDVDTPPRHSTQLPRSSTTQINGKDRRTSRDFDRRTDGPFGRPSITMTRRRSSHFDQNGVPMTPITPVARRGTAATTGTAGATGATDGEELKAEESQAVIDPETSVEATSSPELPYEPEPPPLNYSLYTRKLSIFIFWSLILIDTIAQPIILYFCLWYLTDLSPNTVFSIITAALGGISIFEYFLRFRRLWMKGSKCRVIGARRMYLDWFHWNFTFAWIIIMIELIVGSVPEHPPIRLLSMPLATMCYTFGTELLIVDTMRYFQIPAPCRISSIPKGAQLRPGIYSIIEDVCAVDGSGGTEFREALNRRYEASHVFRAMLRRLGAFWAVGAEAAAVLTTILVFTIGKDAAYVVGWSVPFIWAGFWTLGTWWYVRRKLAEEKKAWAEEVAAKAQGMAESDAAVV